MPLLHALWQVLYYALTHTDCVARGRKGDYGQEIKQDQVSNLDHFFLSLSKQAVTSLLASANGLQKSAVVILIEYRKLQEEFPVYTV